MSAESALLYSIPKSGFISRVRETILTQPMFMQLVIICHSAIPTVVRHLCSHIGPIQHSHAFFFHERQVPP